MSVQSLQIPVAAAVKEAPVTSATLLGLAEDHRLKHTQVDSAQTIRHWDRLARSYCYQTHIAISGQGRERLPWLLEVLYSASSLPTQPRYSQFQGGACTGTIFAVRPVLDCCRQRLIAG